jgi:DNA-binding NtrC family response regulator
MMTVEEIQKKFNIIGNSPEIQKILKTISEVAPTDIPVLILGESGSGKEVIANAIHKLSRRKNHKMISVNCGAIPDGLIESELFGHEKGAFTGAISSKAGYFEIANRGTIFLDEVGELPLQTQVKLLRVLETGEFMRVGGTQYIKVDVRLIAATNRELEKMIDENKFRRDLYYRLKGVIINLPPLRERKEDIPEFVEFFTREFSKKNNLDGIGFTEDAIRELQQYSWPGNVRELKNFVETLLVLSGNKPVTAEIVREHLQDDIYETVETNPLNLPVVTNKTVDQAERELIYRALLSLGIELAEMKKMLGSFMHHIDTRLGEIIQQKNQMDILEQNEIISLDEMERRMIKKALEKFHGNRKKIAEALNISERTLYRKIKEYGLD